MDVRSLLDWFAGGATRYRTLFHCMRNDMPWITITVVLDLAVATGYCLIALHWWRNQTRAATSPAHRALGNMKNIFLYCGICGYLFIPVKMFWPAWRLYDAFLAILAFYTWRYALDSRSLRVVYGELGRASQLVGDLEKSRAESRRKTFFLNAISHDLRTPLNSLLLQAEVAELSLQAQDLASARDSLVELKAGARAAADLLASFLELGRMDWSQDSTHPCGFRLTDLLDALGHHSRAAAAQKGLSLHIEAPADLEVYTDRGRLERIIANLVQNAIKYTQRGMVRVIATATGRDLRVVVEDTGQGIAPEHLGMIFDEFYQVHNLERDRTKGFGLGLSIARRMAEYLGGTIRVESALGRGSRFTVELPRVVVDRVAAGPGPVAQPGSLVGPAAAPLG